MAWQVRLNAVQSSLLAGLASLSSGVQDKPQRSRKLGTQASGMRPISWLWRHARRTYLMLLGHPLPIGHRAVYRRLVTYAETLDERSMMSGSPWDASSNALVDDTAFTTIGSATVVGGRAQLADDKTPNQAGAVELTKPLSTRLAFSVQVEVVWTNIVNGGEGFAIALTDDTGRIGAPWGALGIVGNGMGRVLAIVVDGWHPQDRIVRVAVFDSAAINGNLESAYKVTNSEFQNLRDGERHRIEVHYQPSGAPNVPGVLTVYIDGRLALQYAENLEGIFGPTFYARDVAASGPDNGAQADVFIEYFGVSQEGTYQENEASSGSQPAVGEPANGRPAQATEEEYANGVDANMAATDPQPEVDDPQWESEPSGEYAQATGTAGDESTRQEPAAPASAGPSSDAMADDASASEQFVATSAPASSDSTTSPEPSPAMRSDSATNDTTSDTPLLTEVSPSPASEDATLVTSSENENPVASTEEPAIPVATSGALPVPPRTNPPVSSRRRRIVSQKSTDVEDSEDLLRSAMWAILTMPSSRPVLAHVQASVATAVKDQATRAEHYACGMMECSKHVADRESNCVSVQSTDHIVVERLMVSENVEALHWNTPRFGTALPAAMEPNLVWKWILALTRLEFGGWFTAGPRTPVLFVIIALTGFAVFEQAAKLRENLEVDSGLRKPLRRQQGTPEDDELENGENYAVNLLEGFGRFAHWWQIIVAG